MRHKKIAALLMSASILAGSYRVFALVPPNGSTTVIEGVCRIPEIEVTVPATGSVYINPLQLPVWIDSYSEDNQILSFPDAIQNQSEIPIIVNATVTGQVGESSDMILSTVSTKNAGFTSKRVFIYFEMMPANVENVLYWDYSSIEWAQAYDPAKHILVQNASNTKNNIITLAAAGKEGCCGAFRLAGDCVSFPTNEWNGNDQLTIGVAFTFEAVPPDQI